MHLSFQLKRAIVAPALLLLLVPSSVRADYTVVPNKDENRGVWEGWGCSLCWWGNGVGNSAYQNTYADLFFTLKNVSFFGNALPGLGMNLVRYNVGGGGRNDNIGGATENVPSDFPWFKDIDGYQVNWYNFDPASDSWDWSRDARQRAVLKAALDRGVNHVEFFANAPMWWMTHEKSSAGGALQWWNRRDFMRYLATVAKYARDRWGVRVESIEPFNEPSAGWWTYPKGQEGCNIGGNEQAEMLGYLREELDARGLKDIAIAASDENTMTQARSTHEFFKGKSVSVNGVNRTVDSLVDTVNVHAYNGLDPWRDNAARQRLRRSAGDKRIRMSEYGDPDGSGMALAQTIIEDINHLRPTAWIYWQPLEPYSGWGLVNGDYAGSENAPDRGKPTWIYTKYYVFAQFSRFLRPGFRLLGSNDDNSIVAYDDRRKELVMITLNYGNAQKITYDLRFLKRATGKVAVVATGTDHSKRLFRSVAMIRGGRLEIAAEPNTLYSITVTGATP
ncbi:MAG: glycoside hydrolase [Capsulimonadales bacterium]|nr:glycoside hydrolase [Capsulimonadales bacterium]